MIKFVFLAFLLMVLLSCKKGDETVNSKYLIPENEVPVWLKTQIGQNAKKESSLSAWVRYSWQNEYYFEYIDVASSYSYSLPVSFRGDTLFTYSQNDFNSDLFKRYKAEKCCYVYVWKSTDSTIFEKIKD